MALAACGDDTYVEKFSSLIRLEDGGLFSLNRDYLCHDRYGQVWPFTRKFLEEFGPARRRDEPISDHHRDLAHALQVCTEETVLHVVRALGAVHPSRNLCLTGGVALNCVANARILCDTDFQRVWVPPCASDSGVGKTHLIPAAVHVDGTARIQTVNRTDNPRYYSLIQEFARRTAVPVILNTSFNAKEPIVASPTDAISCYLRSGIDVLVIGNFLSVITSSGYVDARHDEHVLSHA